MVRVDVRGDPPPDEASVVIRSGVLEGRTDEELRDAARENFEDYGFWGLSVLVADPAEVERVCEEDWRVRRYGSVSLSTVRRLRQAGFPLLDTGEEPHFDIVLADLEDDTLERLRRCFDPAQRRPPGQLPT